MIAAGWRLGLLCLVIAALSACAAHRDSFAGIRYQTPTAHFDLTSACVDRIRDTEHTPPALQIHVAPGSCQARFQRFFRIHRGETITAAFQGQRLSEPATIVGPIQTPLMQPVRSKRQAEAVRAYYRAR